MNRWLLGARVRTLPAAAVPVALGAAVGVGQGCARWWTVAVALLVGVSLQVGVNYANDYSDGVRGTDTVRVGPARLVGGGLAEARLVKRAAFIAFGVAAAAGLVLVVTTSWWLIGVGLASILAGWFYTGGDHPYGYIGLGELFVFVFFGLVATVGTTFVLLQHVPAVAWGLASIAGSLACALLVVNNLRDIPGDQASGKRTLAVRIGDRNTRMLYYVLVGVSFALLVVVAIDRPLALMGLLGIAAAARPVRTVARGASGRELIAVLAGTGRLQLVVGALTTLGTALSG